MIYLDNNATTQPVETIPEIVNTYLGAQYGNPSSMSYDLGKKAKDAVETARVKVAELINCEPSEVIFTSGGTESIYSSLLGNTLTSSMLQNYSIITSPTEHPAVNKCIELLKKIYPGKIEADTYRISKEGEFSFKSVHLSKANLVSSIYANNETGILTPMSQIIQEAKENKTNTPFLHSDTVQLIGKLPFSFKESGLDSMSIAAHKLHGPKGVGAMIMREGSAWNPFITGGGQESGRRGGTENVALIAAFGEAAEASKKRLENGEHVKLKELRDYFEELLLNEIKDVNIIGSNVERLPNTTSILVDKILGYEVVEEVAQKGLYISSGSACKSGTLEASKTLLGMGYSSSEALGLLRISFDYRNTKEEAFNAVTILRERIESYRKKFDSRMKEIIS